MDIINCNIFLNINQFYTNIPSLQKKKFIESQPVTDRLFKSIEANRVTDYFSSTSSYVSLFTAESIPKQILFQH